MSGSAFEGGAVIEGEGQLAIRVGCGVIQQAAFHHRDQAHRQCSITHCQSKRHGMRKDDKRQAKVST